MKSKKIFDQIIDDMYEYLDGTDTFFHYDTTKPDEQTDKNMAIIEKFLKSFVKHVLYSDPEFYTYAND